jgi:large conductance mechanosensitive channel
MKGFKEFIMQGNVIDLAVGVVIGGAFTALVTGFVDYIINPIVAAAGGSGSIGLGHQIIADNDATFINVGALISAIITFLIAARKRPRSRCRTTSCCSPRSAIC